jgi:hypothetical protein
VLFGPPFDAPSASKRPSSDLSYTTDNNHEFVRVRGSTLEADWGVKHYADSLWRRNRSKRIELLLKWVMRGVFRRAKM